MDEAIALLEDSIHRNAQGNPQLLLDLLDLAYNHEYPTEFAQCREQFCRLFNASVPEFRHFGNEGRGLADYPSLLDHIRAQWDSPEVLDVMEACMLRTGADTQASPFDLAAFRELLNMHRLASAHHNKTRSR